jgi:hypothetical protein
MERMNVQPAALDAADREILDVYRVFVFIKPDTRRGVGPLCHASPSAPPPLADAEVPASPAPEAGTAAEQETC